MVGRQSSWTVTALYLAVLTHGLTVAHAGFSFGGSMRGAASVVKEEPRAAIAFAGASAEGGFRPAFINSFSMIMVSEIGDETFIIAAIMAMRHPRFIVLAGALSALAVMTVLSTALGLVVPNLLSKETVNKAAFVLYTFFGLRLCYIAWRSDSSSTMVDEVSEVEEKLEAGARAGPMRRIMSRICTPIFLEAFILTFLAEWGDRSQIATIALAAHLDPYGVTVGAIIGHAICTGLAVVGGRIVALRISQRAVAFTGGILFFGFAFQALIYGAPGSELGASV
mmetsp:Transcript_22202/g.54808  ORF Transcript_22202/g.54808 Transcript_22202/m.54808 type:complete len:281 (-) Transcript_22202:434-1276(-)|eukprot:CAMPEP_0181371246 /NCGR_PEP_ID=MMETSP1106-20121128/13958_1 /TAXON_ID=81844 /ORGANISM="Mantoniella antarctica, Strain SL-175" /LENGTH=280 /DNA_ID=CAMNT_0023488295 /DNA_START=233 /DNA_END=1075 /DNA_ORIENTATION=+